MDNEGKQISSNTEASGRYHTDWLNMMYPRLRLARNLLRDDGVIFISIDDNEIENLKKICNEVFGEENFVGCAGRITKKSNNKGDYWAPNFDYLLTYTRSIDSADGFTGGANESAYNIIEEAGERKGERYQLVRLYMSSIQNRNPEQRFWIECPDGTHIIPPGTTFPPERPNLGDGIWRWTRETFIANQDRIVIKQVRSSNLLNDDHQPAKWNIFTKTYLNDVIDNSSAKPNSFIEDHINQIASHELTALDIPFNYAKPTTLAKYLMQVSKASNDAIILDFFSGSASTADAVMQLNAEDGGHRKFIMVQIPERTYEKDAAYRAGYKNIAEIGKERIRRAGDKIKAEIEEQSAQMKIGEEPKQIPDIGFKVFKLDSSNLKKWNGEVAYQQGEDEQLKFDAEKLSEYLNNSIDNYMPGRTELDVVYEIMLKLGLDMTYPVEQRQIAGKNVYSIGYGALMMCMDDEITIDVASGMAALYKELKPETWKVVFKDNGFKDDSTKTNVLEILKASGLEEDAFTTV